ncbi:MAG: glycoside hydrolase family 3 N-terminal domain-containing protein [Candidatus Cryptobacteroides sp.]
MRKFVLFIPCMFAAVAAFAQPQLTADNIDEIIKAMTLEEKVTLLVGGSRAITINGVPTGTTNLVPGAAGVTRAVPRLGIPQTVLADGPAGVRINPKREGDPETYYATAFPVGTALATSWNLDLVNEVTTAMGQEVLEFGVDVLLAPGMNIHRNVLCGRNFEYFSEDPFLSGKMAAAYVKGIQSNGVGTSVKHYATNNQETNRHENDSRVSQRALREIYLKNFEIAIKESNPWTVMSSYNVLNGEYTQQSYDLLTTVLREEWGWDGIVMTDWGNKLGTVKSVKAGNDVMEPGAQNEMERIIDGVKNGEITQEELDRNVRNMLEYIVKTPRFKGYKYSNKPDTDAHAALVRKAGAEGMVLLKNNGVLPLKGDEKVGLWGVTSYDFIAGGTGSGNVNKKYIRNVQEGLEGNGMNVDPVPTSWYKKYIAFTEETMANNSQGVFWGKPVLPEAELSLNFVKKVEASTDVAILTIGRNAGEGGDRKDGQGDFRLTDVESENLQRICDIYHKAGKKVVVVLNIGGVIETASWKHMPDAILLAWQPGMEGGASVADVLLGKVNPSGKLATTFPMNYLDSPSSLNFPYDYTAATPSRGFNRGPAAPRANVDYTLYEEGIYVGYRYFTTAGVEVSYPFGYGLSYTTFSYSKPAVKATADGFTATITVTNTGKVAGKEAVQLYVTAPAGGLDKPALELKAFAKTKELAPGESQTLTMNVCNYGLASFNEANSAWETAAGTYQIHFAASVTDIRATGQYKLKNALNWKVNNVLAPAEPINEIKIK